MEIGSDRVSDHFGVTDLLYHFEFFRELTVEHFFQVIHPATGDFIVIQLLKNRLWGEPRQLPIQEPIKPGPILDLRLISPVNLNPLILQIHP